MSSSTVITCENVAKRYRLGEQWVVALDDFHWEVTASECVALMGPSGSGKSTLLNLLGAVDRADQGRISVAGASLQDLGEDERAHFRNETVGFVFQSFNLIPVLSALENVLLPAQLGSKLSESAMLDRAKYLLDKVGLGPFCHQMVNRLSGGQMQRVAIARALINQPALILADEPTANLDHNTAETVLQTLRETTHAEGATLVIATHDPHVLSYCSRIVRLQSGKILDDTRGPA